MSAAAMSTPVGGADLRVTLRTLAVVTLVVALAAAVAWGLHSAHWPIQEVRIDGAVGHADRARIKAIMAEHTRAGFFGMDLAVLRADLRQLPWVRDASLRRVWPHTLHATIHEQRVAARWNEDALLSRRGVVFTPATIAVTDVPVLAGPVGHGPAMFERLQHFTELLAPLGLDVVALRQDARRAWQLDLGNGVTLRLGQTEYMQGRLARFAALWPRVLAPEAGRIATVDMRYPNGFAVDWR